MRALPSAAIRAIRAAGAACGSDNFAARFALRGETAVALLPVALSQTYKSVQLLLVEDSPGDVRLTREVFRDANSAVQLHIATDGVEAMAFLRHEREHADAPRPDLILLDLNLPKLDGRDVLALIKEDGALRSLPTVVLTASDAAADIVNSYQLRANCYLTKPMHLDDFENLVTRLMISG
jgi:chemotaxis family two-component system response regulator Rcp1